MLPEPLVCEAVSMAVKHSTSLPCRIFENNPGGSLVSPLLAASPLMANRVFDEATLLHAAAILQQQQFQQHQHQQNLIAQATLLSMQQSGSSDFLVRGGSCAIDSYAQRTCTWSV